MNRTLFLPLTLAAAGLAIAACNPRHEPSSASVAPSRSAPPAAPAPPAAQADPAQASPSVATQVPSSVPRDAFSDTVITARTKAAILSDPGMTGSDVSVNTDRGVVSLTGTIKSQEQAAIASAHAQRQDGVLRIDNHLAANLQ
jgi:hyperosmotically inducible periplasmic protein